MNSTPFSNGSPKSKSPKSSGHSSDKVHGDPILSGWKEH
jgi:hypothetical protein